VLGGLAASQLPAGDNPANLLNGVVRDGSGADWRLYARLRISSPGFEAVVFTDPVTGYYAATLEANVLYTIEVDAVGPGYEQTVEDVLVVAPVSAPDGQVQNFDLTADAAACAAPGYAQAPFGAPVFSESFDGGVLPPGWIVENSSLDGGGPWTIHTGADPCGFFDGNRTGGGGPFALVNSNCDGPVTEDTELITPSLDLSALTTVQLLFLQDFLAGGGARADVDVSLDSGANWTRAHRDNNGATGPLSINLTPLAAGQPDVRIRFRYHDAFFGWWWQVDDVRLGEASCVPQSGGLVVGNVRDANTGAGIDGASVFQDPEGVRTMAFATPEDPDQDDGFYILFSESGPQTFQAYGGRQQFGIEQESATVIPNSTVRVDFELSAGMLQISPSALFAKIDPDTTENQTLTLTNLGGESASFFIRELDHPLGAPSIPTGPFADPAMVARARARIPQAGQRSRGVGGFPPTPGAPTAALPVSAGEVVTSFPSGLVAPFGVAFDLLREELWVESDASFGGDDRAHMFRPDGTRTGDLIDNSSWVTASVNDGTYNWRTNRLWFASAGDACIYEDSLNIREPTGAFICPVSPPGSTTDGLAYDPVTDTYYSSALIDGVIYHFDGGGTVLDSSFVGLAIVGLAFNPSTGHLFGLVSHGAGDGFSDVYVLDPRDGYAVLGSFDITDGDGPVLSDFGQGGLELDCAGDLWTVDLLTTTIYAAESGETDACAAFDIPWLAEAPTHGSVLPALSNGTANPFPVTVTFDATGITPGLRQAQLLIRTSTPYALPPVPVDFIVRFLDVPDESFAESYIYAAAGAGIMPGCGGNNFCPNGVVTRADMAGFIERAVHGADYDPPAYAGAFGDVAPGDYNADYIQGLVNDGITAGCGGGNYCPNAVNTRAQMAVFILKGVEGSGYIPPPCAGIFTDVPCPSLFADWIEELFDRGVTAGCGGSNFCPNKNISNAQMSVFLVRAFGIPYLP
jgi:hypothetical protein